MTDNHVVASIGLISDTHYQDRLFELPDGLAQLWKNVDLILHAGDVGELEVLDQLGHIAPVVAVHGNDEPESVKRELPERQLLSVQGLRILLWHSHYPDPLEEKAKRGGPWGPKLDRIADRGRELKADVVVYGHSHVPLISRYADVLLVNPGALASGGYFNRQAVVSVGRLQVFANGGYDVAHFNLATGQTIEFPSPDPEEEFSVLGNRYQDWLVEPDLIADVGALRKIIYEDVHAVVGALQPLYKRCWIAGLIRRQDLIEAIRAGELITPTDRAQVLAVINRVV